MNAMYKIWKEQRCRPPFLTSCLMFQERDDIRDQNAIVMYRLAYRFSSRSPAVGLEV